MKRLDHGSLNVPLAKRGNIDAQIDRYKRDHAREVAAKSKALAAQEKADREQAKGLLADASDDRVRALAARCGISVAAMKKQLKSEAHWNPRLIIKLLPQEPRHD